jgi:hypothetical protein
VLSFYKVWQGFIILVASEAIKDIFIIKTLQNFPLCITVASHYVFPPNSLWVKHGPIERTLRVISENVIIVRSSFQIFYCLERFPMNCSHQC